ncbi:MAG TPA: YceI family protein [Acidisarcina sp.]
MHRYRHWKLRSPLTIAAILLFSASIQDSRGQTAQPDAASAAPQPRQTIHFDPAKSKVSWSVHGTTHTVNGVFQLKGGLITFNPATGVADGEMLVDVSSADSGNSTRDGKMKSQVLEAQKYPTVFFHPTMISGTLKPGSSRQATVDGTLNIHGVDHPLTASVAIDTQGTNVIVKTKFEIPYVAWGMRDPSYFIFRFSKQVEVEVTAQGTVEAAP